MTPETRKDSARDPFGGRPANMKSPLASAASVIHGLDPTSTKPCLSASAGGHGWSAPARRKVPRSLRVASEWNDRGPTPPMRRLEAGRSAAASASTSFPRYARNLWAKNDRSSGLLDWRVAFCRRRRPRSAIGMTRTSPSVCFNGRFLSVLGSPFLATLEPIRENPNRD